MNLSVELTDHEATRLQAQAQALGITAEQLARSVLADLLSEQDDQFRVVAERVLEENKELYTRLR